MDWNRILPDLYVGSCPTSEDDVLALVDLGVGVVINLQTDEDMEDHSMPWEDLEALYEEHGFEGVRVEMIDHDMVSIADSLPEAVETLHRYLDDGWSVYLHCTSGVNRAPTVAVGYMASHEDMSVDEAAAHMTSRRDCLPFVDAVEELLED